MSNSVTIKAQHDAIAKRIARDVAFDLVRQLEVSKDKFFVADGAGYVSDHVHDICDVFDLDLKEDGAGDKVDDVETILEGLLSSSSFEISDIGLDRIESAIADAIREALSSLP
jgi:hypothetical protein